MLSELRSKTNLSKSQITLKRGFSTDSKEYSESLNTNAALNKLSSEANEYFAALQLAKDSRAQREICDKYSENFKNKQAAVDKSLKMFDKMPQNVKDQYGREFESLIYAFAQRLCIAMSVALPIVADELA